jgi:hypothetical protein
MNHQRSNEALKLIQSNAFQFQMAEHCAALMRVFNPARDVLSLSKQYEFLQFVMENYPNAVMEYLSREPEHFKGLAQQSTDAGMATYVHAVAEKIFNYSIMGKIVARAVARHKPNNAGGSIFAQLQADVETEFEQPKGESQL